MKYNKKEEKLRILKEARDLRFNRELSYRELAQYFGKSERTIIRWFKEPERNENDRLPQTENHHQRPRKYPPTVFARILALKKEVPQRSAALLHRLLIQEKAETCPSISTIRNYVRVQGLTYQKQSRKEGYIKFQRKKANELWQVDIAGVQTIGNLGKLYLFALLDDCSRYIVAAEYFTDQKGQHLLKIIRDAVITYGCPNEILADNGLQFRNVIGELGTKYAKLLERLNIKPIFASPYHPQTKGKLERWFGVVIQSCLLELRYFVECHPECNLPTLNQEFQKWVRWYNTEKSHRSLPHRCTPQQVFQDEMKRIYRPVQTQMDWEEWLNTKTIRRVTKYNQIQYKAQQFTLPPGFAGLKVNIIEYETKIDCYCQDRCIASFPYQVTIKQILQKISRKIGQNGLISYKGKHYMIDYKYAGKRVEVQESNDGQNLLIYFNSILIKTLQV
jgi:transposase InsO family protein